MRSVISTVFHLMESVILLTCHTIESYHSRFIKLCFQCLVLSVLLITDASAQSVVSGVVLDEEGQGIPGATILVGQTNRGTITDVNGTFQLSVGETSVSFLIISATGYESKTIYNLKKQSLNVTLPYATTTLEEVTVSALGVEKQTRSLGYATANITKETIEKNRPINALNTLKAKVPGVVVSSTSGSPGASTRIVVRGYQSITGSNDPLYIIDGIPVNNQFNNYSAMGAVSRVADYGNRVNDINPDDIESISVLKGVSAAAIYGSRAANGAIIIKTKTADTPGKIGVTINSGISFDEILRVPAMQNTYAQGWNLVQAPAENGSWGPVADGRNAPWGNVVNNAQLFKDNVILEDNLRDFYETGVTFQNSINISGQSNKTSYALTYGNTESDGIVPGGKDKLSRNILSFNARTFSEKATVAFYGNYINKSLSVVPSGGTSEAGPSLYQEILQVPRDISIVDMQDYNNEFYNYDNFFTPYIINPYAVIGENDNTFDEDRFYGNVTASYFINDWLDLTLRLGGDFSSTNAISTVRAIERSEGSPNQIASNNINARIDVIDEDNAEWNGDLMLSGQRSLNRSLKVNGLLGLNLNERRRDLTRQQGSGFEASDNISLANLVAAPIRNTYEEKRRIGAVYAETGLSFKDYLYLTANYRIDKSSTLPEANRSYSYYSANTSFVFSELFNVKAINYGKLRAGWGRAGNDPEPYRINDVYTSSQSNISFGSLTSPIASAQGFEVSNRIGNLNLSPEFTYEHEFGIEMEFWKRRFRYDITYYNRTTDSQILERPLDPGSGYTVITTNASKIRNRGIELLIGVTPIRAKDFSWDIIWNYHKNENRVLDLVEDQVQIAISVQDPQQTYLTGTFGTNLVAVKGRTIGEIETHKGLFSPSGNPIVNSGTGYQLVDPNERQLAGSVLPDYTMGFTNVLRYKGLTLSSTLDVRKGGLIYASSQHLLYFSGNHEHTTFNNRQPFILPNSVVEMPNQDGSVAYVENSTAIQGADLVGYYDLFSNTLIGNNHILDRSFVKLREVSLTYDFSKQLRDAKIFRGLVLSVYGRNLLLWTPESNKIIDPEGSNFGSGLSAEFGEFQNAPSTRSYGFNVKVKL